MWQPVGLLTCSIPHQVLNALAIDPGQSWKGVWRWWDEEVRLRCIGQHTRHCVRSLSLSGPANRQTCPEAASAATLLTATSDTAQAMGAGRADAACGSEEDDC